MTKSERIYLALLTIALTALSAYIAPPWGQLLALWDATPLKTLLLLSAVGGGIMTMLCCLLTMISGAFGVSRERPVGSDLRGHFRVFHCANVVAFTAGAFVMYALFAYPSIHPSGFAVNEAEAMRFETYLKRATRPQHPTAFLSGTHDVCVMATGIWSVARDHPEARNAPHACLTVELKAGPELIELFGPLAQMPRKDFEVNARMHVQHFVMWAMETADGFCSMNNVVLEGLQQCLTDAVTRHARDGYRWIAKVELKSLTIGMK